MFNVLRFWLDRGVDGFRVDVIYHIVKDDQFRDNPRNPDYRPGQNPHQEFFATYITDRPEVHDIIAGMRKVIDEFPGRMMVGEIYLPVERLVMYYGDAGHEGKRGSGVHMPFNFQLITMAWNARTISEAIRHYENSLPSYGWPNWVLGNHDNPRIASRVGCGQARVAAMMLLTLRGTPTMYYGDEVGMCDVPIPKDRVQDPFEKNVPGMGLGRDPERTPMQWDGSGGAGFTREGVEPWLPLGCDFTTNNVAAQREDSKSFLALYRKLIELRRPEPALTIGAYEPVSLPEDVGEMIAYVRHAGEDGRRFLVVLNLSDKPQTFRPLDATTLRVAGRILLSTHLDRDEKTTVAGTIELRANEGVVVLLSTVE
jgi:alpha-glucosidase